MTEVFVVSLRSEWREFVVYSLLYRAPHKLRGRGGEGILSGKGRFVEKFFVLRGIRTPRRCAPAPLQKGGCGGDERRGSKLFRDEMRKSRFIEILV